MIDVALAALAAAMGAVSCVLAPTALMIVAAAAAVAALLGALAFRRTGLLVACGALLAACALGAYLDSPEPMLWQALAHGIGLLALLDIGWDRVRLVPARLGALAYAARLAAIGRVGLLSAVAVFVAVTLGYGTAFELGLTLPLIVAACAAALAGLAGALLVWGALRRR